MEEGSDNATLILNAAGNGDRQAAEVFIPIVYAELCKLAAWRLSQEAGAHTLQATALVQGIARPCGTAADCNGRLRGRPHRREFPSR